MFKAARNIRAPAFLFMGMALLCFAITGFHIIEALPRGYRIAINAAGLVSFLFAFFTWAGLTRKLDAVVACMLAFSLFLCITHYLSTSIYQYATDVNGHIHYIKTIAYKFALPDPRGWQSQQPPLYYLVSALFYKAGYALGMAHPVQMVRLLSLLLYVGFLIVSLLMLRHFFKERLWLVTASSLVLFWPDGFTYAGRIGNDLGILFVHALVLYWLVRWNEEKQAKYLRWCIYASFTALIIKGSGVIAIGATGLMCLIALYHREIAWRQLLRWPLIAFCAGCIALNFGRTLYYRLHGMNIKWFINLELNQIKDALVGNTPYHYFYFDIASFIREPFFYSVPDGLPLFWNAFLKTLLLGEWDWQSPHIASIVSALLLFILFYALAFTLFKISAAGMKPFLPLLVMMLCMTGALMVARIQVPWACQANGRYVYGIVVIFAILFTSALKECAHGKKPVLMTLGFAVTLAFSMLSILLIIRENPLLSQ